MYSLFLLLCVLCIVLSPFAADAFLTAAERRAFRQHHEHDVNGEEVQG